MKAATSLDATLIDMRFVKPLDEATLLSFQDATLFVTIEENAIMGGAGSAVLECLQSHHISVPVLQLGLPDRYEEHASHSSMLKRVGLDEDSILAAIQHKLTKI